MKFLLVIFAFAGSAYSQAVSAQSPVNLADRFEHLSCALVRLMSDDGTYGTGFFISDDGTIVTAAHVVMATSFSLVGRVVHVTMVPKPHLRVTTHYGVTREVELTSSQNDEQMAATDLAVIRTSLRPACHLEIGDSAPVRVGTHLIGIGYPTFDTLPTLLQHPPTNPTPVLYDGFLSSRHIHLPIQVGMVGLLPFSTTYEVMRIQMPVTGGASGGPIITDDDKVIGIITEETAIWPPELTDYDVAIGALGDDVKSDDKIQLPSGKEVDARKILGTLIHIVHDFESPGAGLAVPTANLKLSRAANR